MPKQHIKYIKHTKIQPENLKIKLESYITDKTAACFFFHFMQIEQSYYILNAVAIYLDIPENRLTRLSN